MEKLILNQYYDWDTKVTFAISSFDEIEIGDAGIFGTPIYYKQNTFFVKESPSRILHEMDRVRER